MSYVLPIRSTAPVSAELLSYLQWLESVPQLAEVIVVDGSEPSVFADFQRRCAPGIRHVGVDRGFARLSNGKVAGVLSGLQLASGPYVVIADDDVRYDQEGLVALQRHLGHADLVRPQNYFDPLPWHACLDTARTLINRMTGGDWPGTFGVRLAALRRTGGYDGNVLFENLELVRTVRASGGRELRLLNLFVRRLPPDTHHFWAQRVRQAYDEFARPLRLLTGLALAPVLVLLVMRWGWSGLGVAVLAPMIVAEIGRRRGGGARVFPAIASLIAPLWTLERAACAWLALAARVVLGGVPYGGRILTRAATPVRTLARKYGREHLTWTQLFHTGRT